MAYNRKEDFNMDDILEVNENDILEESEEEVNEEVVEEAVKEVVEEAVNKTFKKSKHYCLEFLEKRLKEYDQETNPERKEQIANSINRLLDTLVKFEEDETNDMKISTDNDVKLQMNENDNRTKLKIAKMQEKTKVKLAIKDSKDADKVMYVNIAKDALMTTGKIAGGVLLKDILTKYLITEFTGAKPATWGATKIGERIFTNYMSKLMI